MEKTETRAEKPLVLVVDDDDDLREVIVESLQTAGYNVIDVSSGIKAIGALKAHRVHVMISDIRMPGISGIELFNQTRLLGIPTVLISGFVDMLDLDRAISMGAADFIAKPFGLEDLINSIEVALLAGKTSLVDDTTLDGRFCRVNIENFLSGSRASQDVYVQLQAGKFLRIARLDSPLSMERVKSYKEKGLRFLFIKNEDFGSYVGFNVGVSKAALSSKSKIPSDQKLRLLNLTSALYLQNLRVNGISTETYCDGCVLVETTLANIVRDDELFTLLELLRSHSDFSYSHSLAVSLYSTLLAKQLGWESPAALFKVAMAGLLIDIGEKEIPSVIVKKYHNDRVSMTADEISMYESHPVRGRNLLKNIESVPEEVQIAVLQHHESMCGHGYPNRPPRLKIQTMSRILNLVNAYCDIVFQRSEKRGEWLAPAAMAQLYPDRENEFDPQMIRALFGVLQLPIPPKLVNLRRDSATVA